MFQLMCIVLMALAITLEISRPLKVLLIAAGGILFSFSTYIPKYKAKTMIAACNGTFNTITYSFFIDHFVAEQNSDTLNIDYSDIKQIIKTEKYIFLFLDSHRAYVIDSSRIRPKEPEALLRFLSEAIGTNPKNIILERKRLFV